MFILGHIGITIGIILVGLLILKRKELLSKLDFRIIAVFAILPDLIDKIIGHVILGIALNQGRLFCHTLIFLGIFSIIYFIILRAYWWLCAFPIATHQVFDLMWDAPNSWFWPAFGFGFKKSELDILRQWLDALISDPYIISTELLGFSIIIIIFVYFKLYKKENLISVLKTGKVGGSV